MRYEWDAIVGETLDGRYVLQRFDTEIGGSGRFVTAEGLNLDVLPTEAADAAEVGRRWQFLAGLQHPGVLRIQESGSADLAGVPVVFCLSERPEDTLASVLAERPLTEDERKLTADAIRPALDYVQSRGASLTSFTPGSIVAVGESVKLSLDDAKPGPGRVWTAADLNRVLGIPEPVVAKPAPVAEVRPAMPAPAPVTTHRPVPPQPSVSRPEQAPVPPLLAQTRKMAIAAAGVVGLSLVVWGVTRSRDEAPAPVPAVQTARPNPVSPDPVKPAPTAAKERPAPSGDWSVIVGSYRDRRDAEKRVKGLLEIAPHAEVVTRDRKHFVAIARSLSRAEADRVLREARAAGVRRGAYVGKLP